MAYIAVKRRMGPIGDPFDQSMFDRVVVDVIHMPPEIEVVAYGMFPIPTLPSIIFALCVAMRGTVTFRNRPRESALDGAPPPGVIGVSRRHAP